MLCYEYILGVKSDQCCAGISTGGVLDTLKGNEQGFLR